MASRSTLPELSISEFMGVETKSSPETREIGTCDIGINLWFFKTYGGVAKFPGSKRVLTSPIIENGEVTRVPWISSYKNPNILPPYNKQTVFQAGTKLFRLNNDGSYTVVTDGLKTDMYRSSDRLDDQLYITGQSFRAIGMRDRMMRYDGQEVNRWGVWAPGTEETVVETFDSLTGFDTNNVTLSQESTITWDGTSIKAIPNNGVLSYSFHKKLAAGTRVPTRSANRLLFYVYIQPGSLQKLAGTGTAIRVHLSTDTVSTYLADAGNFKFDFPVGQLVEGWNQLPLNLLNATSPFDPSIVAVQSFQVTVFLAAAATTTVYPTLIFDYMFVRDVGVPVVTEGVAVETVESFNDNSIWTSLNGATTKSTNNAIYLEGGGSIQLNKINDTFNTIGIYRVLTTPLNLADTVNKQLYFYVYVPTPENLFQVRLKLGSDATPNNYSEFYVSNTWAAGWNLVTIDLSTANAVGGAGVTLSSIAYLQVSLVFTQIEAVENGYLVDYLHRSAPSATGALKGTYSYRITYITKRGTESNAGPVSADVTLPTGGSSVVLTSIPVSPDPQVIARNVYRTAGDGSEYLYLTTIEDNATTTYTDNIADGALLPVPPPEAGRSDFDNSPPPNANKVNIWRRTAFLGGDPLNPTVLYFSATDDLDYFPLLNAFELDTRITGLYSTYLGLVVTTETSLWRVIGDNPDFLVEKIVDGYGGVGPRASGSARVFGYVMDRDGVRLYDMQNTLKISETIRDIFDEQFSKVNIEDCFSVHSRRYNSLIFGIPDSTGVFTELWNYEYAADAIQEGKWSQIEPPAALEFITITEIEDSLGDFRLYAGGSDGMIYELFDEAAQGQWEHADGTKEPVNMKIRFPFMRDTLSDAGDQFEARGRVRPRFIELRAEALDSTTHSWTVQVETSNGLVKTSKVKATLTIPYNFAHHTTVARQPVKSMDIGESMRFTIENKDPKMVILYSMNLKFDTHPNQPVLKG